MNLNFVNRPIIKIGLAAAMVFAAGFILFAKITTTHRCYWCNSVFMKRSAVLPIHEEGKWFCSPDCALEYHQAVRNEI